MQATRLLVIAHYLEAPMPCSYTCVRNHGVKETGMMAAGCKPPQKYLTYIDAINSNSVRVPRIVSHFHRTSDRCMRVTGLTHIAMIRPLEPNGNVIATAGLRVLEVNLSNAITILIRSLKRASLTTRGSWSTKSDLGLGQVAAGVGS